LKDQYSENVPSSSPGKVGFHSSETKQYERTTRSPDLFVLKRRIRGDGHYTENLSWARVPVKVVSVARCVSMLEEGNP
jgi:hypothetical protein